MKLTDINLTGIEEILKTTITDCRLSFCKITNKSKNDDKLELKIDIRAHYELKEVIGSSSNRLELYRICQRIKDIIGDIAKVNYGLTVALCKMDDTTDQSYKDNKRSARFRMRLKDWSEIEVEVCVNVVYRDHDILRKINNILHSHFESYEIEDKTYEEINDKYVDHKPHNIEIRIFDRIGDMTFNEVNKKIYSLLKPLGETNDELLIRTHYLQDFINFQENYEQ